MLTKSSMIMNAKKNPNFPHMVKFLDMELPEQEIYCPPLTIRVLDCRSAILLSFRSKVATLCLHREGLSIYFVLYIFFMRVTIQQ